MNPKTSLLVAFMVIPSISHSAIILNDTFADGDFTTGVEWFKNTSGSALSVVNDGAMGGNALQFDTNPAFRATTAAIPTSSLINDGDFIKLSFSFRYTLTPTDSAGGLRFGIYSNPVLLANTADDVSTGSGNTATGYYMNLVSGPTTQSAAGDFAGTQLIREFGTTSGILGGTDRASLAPGAASGLGVTNTSLHTASLLITKTGANYSLVGQFDGNTVTSGTATTLYNGFNTIAISTANNDINLLIDNVMVEFVPEPSTVGLCAMAGLALVARRRRGA